MINKFLLGFIKVLQPDETRARCVTHYVTCGHIVNLIVVHMMDQGLRAIHISGTAR